MGFIKTRENGTPLPTEEELCDVYQISRPTVRQAMKELETNGMICRLKGKGSFIVEPKINQEFLTRFEDFEDRMERLGYSVHSETTEFEIVAANEIEASSLSIPLNTQVYKIRGIKYANQIPMVIYLSYLPVHLYPTLNKTICEQKSIAKIITEEYGYLVEKYQKTIEIKTASDYEAQLLTVKKGAPLQYIDTISFDNREVPLEFSMERYRSDKNKFRIFFTSNH
ncbi:GntR family transcriptional regulator [uncultured Sphaerochaeta sp.]|uniref:GntR family transcriptional regulator n=1 Tax=uncultured Sphaerochaeta sp. TaxID=886478 RepID=UPI002A0A8A7D|nr:GntR family transcriptional regulator [uncultured Sphaerochaeta sp.]